MKLKVYAFFYFIVSKRKVKGSLHLSFFEMIFYSKTKVNEIFIFSCFKFHFSFAYALVGILNQNERKRTKILVHISEIKCFCFS